MPYAFKNFMHQALNGAFYLFLGLFIFSITWNWGWNLSSDPYALGPYLPWLDLIFPLAGIGLWGLFFVQWCLGELRPLHTTRWFYLLFFMAVLMVNVLFSVNPENSLAWLSLWLTGSLALTIDWQRIWHRKWFWTAYGFALAFSLLLWEFYPNLIDRNIWLLAAWFGVLQAWQNLSGGLARYTLMVGTLLWLWWWGGGVGLQILIALSFVFLWGSQYRLYRRRSLRPWFGALTTLGLFIGFILGPQIMAISFLQPDLPLIAGTFVWWHGVGLGQLEWAQYLAQTSFADPDTIISSAWALRRWWYESGILMFIWLPILWFLSLGHRQPARFKTSLFWGIIILAPSLWLTPGGILLGCVWFFNRESWKLTTEPPLKARRSRG